MKYRVWCPDVESAHEGKEIEAAHVESAAKEHLSTIDSAFPDENENDGDKCTIAVAEWSELGDDDDEPEHKLVTFKLVIERRVEIIS